MNKLPVSFLVFALGSFLSVVVMASTPVGKPTPAKIQTPLASQLFGTWYSKSTEDNVTEHYLITRSSDYLFTSKMMYVNHKKKHYVIDTDSGKWSLKNNIFKEVYKNAGAENAEVITYKIINTTAKTFVYWVDFEDDGKKKYSENKSTLKVLPKPPKGYKEVDLDTFYREE